MNEHNSNGAKIGCAGWTIAKSSAPEFDVAGSHLERYAKRLNAVEINSSFYRPHQAKTYARWAGSVPDNFRFSVKIPRTISHEARLVDSGDTLQTFADQVTALGDKLGFLLLQLPPSLVMKTDVVARYFEQMVRRFSCPIACEARHASWFNDEATQLLRQYGITRVLADPVVARSGPHIATTQASYLRLHGSPRVYYSAYADEVIAQISGRFNTPDAWCIFDNTAAGAALPNALALTALLPQFR